MVQYVFYGLRRMFDFDREEVIFLHALLSECDDDSLWEGGHLLVVGLVGLVGELLFFIPFISLSVLMLHIIMFSKRAEKPSKIKSTRTQQFFLSFFFHTSMHAPSSNNNKQYLSIIYFC
jgi:hypothetical protein